MWKLCRNLRTSGEHLRGVTDLVPDDDSCRFSSQPETTLSLAPRVARCFVVRQVGGVASNERFEFLEDCGMFPICSEYQRGGSPRQ